ncbi:MAG: serine/threonine-protein phosphatase, partial [Planctomycetes bacterium]|nr:serine/threonine-protein phosphatase [Planctomycetota bacterium]
RHANSERFMTAVLMAFDYKHNQFCYVSAGHNPILWIHNGEAIWLESNCLPLGIMMDVPCQRSKIRDYSKDDYFILYTDGFVEAMNPKGEYYGEQRLQDLMLDGVKESKDIEGLMDVLYADTESWLAGVAPDDDLTIVIIKCQDLNPEAS